MHIVRPPRPGASKRIFAPGEQRPAPRSGGGKAGTQAWFWEIHSPRGMRPADRRWNSVIATLARRHAVGRRLTSARTLDAVIGAHGGTIAAAARQSGVSPALIAAVISVESAGRVDAVSPKGAQGLMQLIPATAKRFGVSRPFDPRENISGGAAYLDWLLRTYRGDVLFALAGYNAGEGAVNRHNGVPPYRETRDYVVKVMDAVALARTRCEVPPAGPRQPCVWK